MANLDGHTAVITGASGALGRHVTKAFLEAGAYVIGIEKTTKESSGSVKFIAAELTTTNQAQAAVEAAHAVRGRIDSLVHLVGGFTGGSFVAENNPAMFDAMFDVNVRSSFNVLRAALPFMQVAGRGSIVLTGSRAAIEPAPGAALYAASKAALVSLTRSVASEYAKDGITVNAVLPGTMDTANNRAAMPGADFSKWVTPDDVARLIVFLASPEAASITGAAIPILGRGV